MIKHLLEENITDIEIKYFIDCFRNKRVQFEGKKSISIKRIVSIKDSCKATNPNLARSLGYGKTNKLLYGESMIFDN